MNFDCKEIEISDDHFGCSITFSDSRDEGNIEKQSYKEIMESMGEYLNLQRSYAENEFETDYYTIELSDFEKSGELEDFAINLSRTRFLMSYRTEIIDIQLETDELLYGRIRDVLNKIINGRGLIRVAE